MAKLRVSLQLKRNKSIFYFLFRLIFFTTICISNTYSQKSTILKTYIEQGLSQNTALQQQDLDLRRAQEAIRQSKILFYPTAQFKADYTLAVGGRRLAFPIGDILNPVYENLNGLNKALMTGAPLYPTNIENVNEQFLPNNFQTTKISFAYPLYNTDLKYNRQIQEHLYESKAAQKAAYQHELTYQITEAYLQYLQALEAEKIWVNAKTVLNELRRFNESLVKNNVATKDIITTADYEISKADNEIFKLRSTQNTAKAYFNFLINRDLQSEVIADTTLLHAASAAFLPDQLVQQAWEQRAEFKAVEAGMNAAETAVKLQDANRKRPDAYIGGETGFQGYGYNFRNQGYVLAQIGLTYDLFDNGLRKSKAQQARIDAEKSHKQFDQLRQQIALQVTVAWNAYTAAQNTFKTTEAGLAAAEATYRIVNNKYRANQALLIEYLDAQNRVTTARLQQVLAWTEVLLKETEVEKALGALYPSHR
jgi:outer membrane protein TolC